MRRIVDEDRDMHVVQGTATVVTGGEMRAAHEVAPFLYFVVKVAA